MPVDKYNTYDTKWQIWKCKNPLKFKGQKLGVKSFKNQYKLNCVGKK